MAYLTYKPLTLQKMVLISLSANLFKKSNIILSISKFNIQLPLSKRNVSLQVWGETVEVKLQDEISKLELPSPLSKLLTDVVKIMGNHVRKWKEFHEEYLQMEEDSKAKKIHFNAEVLEKLCMTADGSVDYRKTAEELICSDLIDAVKKFKLASLYCLEDYISIFWRELPKENQRYFCSKEKCIFNEGLGQEFFWPFIITGKECKLKDFTRNQISFHRYAFQHSIKKGNKSAAEHFFQKMKHEEKGVALMRAARDLLDNLSRFRGTTQSEWDMKFPLEKVSELLRYLLLAMDPEQQKQIFQETPVKVLKWFLIWPLQDMFLEIADAIWNCLPDLERDKVLFMMYDKLRKPDNSCRKLFQDFFLRIPSNFWISFVDRQCKWYSYFKDILYHQDMKAIEIFFRSLKNEARKKLIFSEHTLNFFHDCLSKGKLDVFKLFFRETSLSQEDKKRLKEDFMGYLTSINVSERKLRTRKWLELFHLLEETNGASKRCSEDKMQTESKKRKT